MFKNKFFCELELSGADHVPDYQLCEKAVRPMRGYLITEVWSNWRNERQRETERKTIRETDREKDTF